MTFHQACWLISVHRDRLIGNLIDGMHIQELVVVPLGKWAAAFDLCPDFVGVSRMAVLDFSDHMEVVLLVKCPLKKLYVLPWELNNTIAG